MYIPHQKEIGFTLLEIMVVMVILGLLASLTIPNLMSNKITADYQKARSDITIFENALDMYKLDNQYFPSNDQGLTALVLKPKVPPFPKNYRQDGYIRRLPRDPWGENYQIRNPGKHNLIDVFSSGPDRIINTSDDIGNWIVTTGEREEN